MQISQKLLKTFLDNTHRGGGIILLENNKSCAKKVGGINED